MTVAPPPYHLLTREELISLLEKRDKERKENIRRNVTDTPTIKRIISEVLTLLFNEEHSPIEKSMKLLLNFFDADWGYVALLENDGKMVSFPCEVMSSWMIKPKEDHSELTYETMPWIINTVKAGLDIVLCHIDDLPPEASVDKKLLEMQGLKSMLIIPLIFHHKPQGFIGFDSTRVQRDWTDLEVEDMHIIANIFSILIERWQNLNTLKKSRKLLSELTTKFKLFFDKLPLGVELYDADGYLIDVNNADLEIFGTCRERLLGVNLFDNPNIPENIITTIKQEKDYDFTLLYNFDKVQDSNYYSSSLDNQIKHLQIKGLELSDEESGKVGYLIIVSDNTRKVLETEQIENNFATLKAILLSGRSIVGEYDIEKDLLFIDPGLNDHMIKNKVFSYLMSHQLSYDELNNIADFEHSEYNNEAPFFSIINGNEPSRIANCKLTVEDETVWVRINAQAYKKGDNGLPGKIVCYITNTTEEKQLEQKLRQAEDDTRRTEQEMLEAREADKLKSAFLANMSHEIRTPLNAIVGFSNIIAETNDNEEKKEYIDIINKNNDLLLRLITDILDFSKIESGVLDYSLTNVSLKEICQEQLKVHSLKIPKDVSLICDLDTLPEIALYTDPKRITQVISNLISNATKFTETGSITLDYHVSENQVLVEVTDTGIGISQENLHSIFGRFVKINSFKQGTGLGLTICKTIVEALKGTIGVDSQLGVGSRFWFTLPIR